MRLRERGQRVRIRSRAPAQRIVPVLEPTGRFSVPAPARAPKRRRGSRRVRRVSPVWGWLWRNAEPLVWGATLSALALSLWFSPRTQLTNLEVVGAPVQAHAALHMLLHAHLRQPIALHDTPREVERAVRALDWVRAVHWQSMGIGRARLIVTPREPFAQVRFGDGSHLFVDPTGFPFRPLNPEATPTAGVIRLVQDEAHPRTGSYGEGEMQAALTILHALRQRADVHYPRVLVCPTRGIRLYATVRGGTEPPVPVQVRFGDASQLSEQITMLQRLLDAPLTDLRQWEYVDISAPDSGAVKPRVRERGMSDE